MLRMMRRIADETVRPSGAAHVGALMARYFFHIKGGASLIEDEEGSEFETAEDARTAAIRSLREIFAASVKSGADGPVVDAILIADESGQELVLLPLAEVLPRWFQVRMRAVSCSGDGDASVSDARNDG
jgi:hypothetical protein